MRAKKKKQKMVLLKTPFCVLVAYLLRILCTKKKKYRNTLYCVVVAYLVRSCCVLGIFLLQEHQKNKKRKGVGLGVAPFLCSHGSR